jgi:hypothetical protein
MEMFISKVAYIVGTPAALMDKIRSECNNWADGDENICLTFEDAMDLEIDELKPFLQDLSEGCDIIISK